MTRIYIRDDLPPESEAMLQALYSRSPASVVEHLKKVEKVGPAKFMDRYYVGYGHASIGDCGTTTIFIEDVSMLAAKAIQDWPLYRGQEASTRYMDFSKVRIENPVNLPVGQLIQDTWMDFYHLAQKPLLDHLYAKYPKQEGEKDDVYERAIHAHKFDILRSFLPAGATTNLSWHTDLRQAQDHLDWLEEHPDRTIRTLAHQIQDVLDAKYPSSFRQRIGEGAIWRATVSEAHTYSDFDHSFLFNAGGNEPRPIVRFSHSISDNDLIPYHDLFSSRPWREVLPRFLDEVGQIWSRFFLDFGSFRDLQRHRNGVVRMPLLSTRWGFHGWYYDQMPPALSVEARRVVKEQTERIERLGAQGVSKVEQQYYVAMGFLVACKVTQTLPAYVYRIELRTSPSVHPTLRAVAQREAQLFADHFPQIKIYPDMSPDTWDTRRGKQTILER